MKNFRRILSGFFFALALVFPLLFSCGKSGKREEEISPLRVRMSPVTVKESSDELKGFGSLSYLKKFELSSPLDGILEALYFREGDSIDKGDIVGVLKNPQVTLAARRAEDAFAQALAAKDLAAARLRDSELSAEARLLGIEKSRGELVQAGRVLDEEKRKSLNREALYAAGGLSEEAIREERFRLDQAENQFSLLEKELEVKLVGLREEDLAAAGIFVPEEKDELRRAFVRMLSSSVRAEAAAAEANLEAAAREMESSRLMEEELRIKSPGPGIVGARYTEEGERVKKDDRILTIMETDSLYAIFSIPESEAAKLKKGMSAEVISGDGETYEGIVDLVSPQADNQSFTFLARILLLPREGSPLKPGMFARVSVSTGNSRKITVIPEAALAAKKDNAGKVFTIRNNILSERNVVLGSLRGDEREIVSGLASGEVVALDPNPAFKEGVYVSAAESTTVP